MPGGDHGDDERAEADDAGGEAPRVAALEHAGAEDAGLHGGVGDGRAGDAAHHGGEDCVDLGEAGAHVAGEHGRKLHQPVGDARFVQEVAGEHEEGDGEQHEALRLGEGELHRDAGRQGRLREEKDGAGDADGETDRHAHEHQDEKGGEYFGHVYILLSAAAA